MADISDVQAALVDLIVAELYPNGVGGPGGFDIPVTVYAGWPDPQTLEEDLKTSGDPPRPQRLHVSVWKLPMERDRTRMENGWMEKAIPAATYEAAILGNTITISGSAPVPFRGQNIAVGLAGYPHAFVHQTQAGDTPAQIATSLAALVAVQAPGTVAALADITIPQPHHIAFARVGVIGETMREVARTETGFQVTIWANNNAERVALAKRLDPMLAGTIRTPLADGSMAHLTRRSSADLDRAQGQGAYRRDLVYSVEYAITQNEVAPQIVAFETALEDPTGETIAETME